MRAMDCFVRTFAILSLEWLLRRSELFDSPFTPNMDTSTYEDRIMMDPFEFSSSSFQEDGSSTASPASMTMTSASTASSSSEKSSLPEKQRSSRGFSCTADGCYTRSDIKYEINEKKLYKIPLVPVNCSFGIVTDDPDNTIELGRMAVKEQRVQHGNVTVVFAIRRPGCGACRERGLDLAELANEEPDVCFTGVVKETGVDDAALLDFYQNYYRFPIYKDPKWRIFRAMGDRKIGMMKLVTTLPSMLKRFKARNITNTMGGGDGFTQGGVLVFDKQGKLRHVHYENYGEQFDAQQLKEAIEAARHPLTTQ